MRESWGEGNELEITTSALPGLPREIAEKAAVQSTENEEVLEILDVLRLPGSSAEREVSQMYSWHLQLRTMACLLITGMKGWEACWAQNKDVWKHNRPST